MTLNLKFWVWYNYCNIGSWELQSQTFIPQNKLWPDTALAILLMFVTKSYLCPSRTWIGLASCLKTCEGRLHALDKDKNKTEAESCCWIMINTKDIYKIKERWTHCNLFSTLVLTISSFVPAEMYKFSFLKEIWTMKMKYWKDVNSWKKPQKYLTDENSWRQNRKTTRKP